jgi:23S rRNA pseudouridine2605 synthase
MRLNTFIARTGLCSRRKADKLIASGKIKINGKIVTILGTKIDPEKDIVEYDSKILKLKKKKTYILLNKPSGYITTTKDERGRKTVMDLLQTELKKKRLFPVGRLDKDATGLLILTDDGKLANKLMHPSSEIEKTYEVMLNKPFQKIDRIKLIKGVTSQGESLKAKSLRIKGKQEIELKLIEGKKREIKRMLEELNYKVKGIKRIKYAFLNLKDVEEGNYRKLSEKEIKRLKQF